MHAICADHATQRRTPKADARSRRARLTPVPRLPRGFSPLRHRDFRLLWSGSLVSSIGTWMQRVAQGWLVLTLTGSPFWLGVDAFLGDAPFLLFSLFGGVLADRAERRRILLVSQVVQMTCSFTLAGLGNFSPFNGALNGVLINEDEDRRTFTIEALPNAEPVEQFVEKASWIERFNVNYHLGVDGISVWFVLLTAFITVVVVISAWQVIEERVAQYMGAFLCRRRQHDRDCTNYCSTGHHSRHHPGLQRPDARRQVPRLRGLQRCRWHAQPDHRAGGSALISLN